MAPGKIVIGVIKHSGQRPPPQMSYRITSIFRNVYDREQRHLHEVCLMHNGKKRPSTVGRDHTDRHFQASIGLQQRSDHNSKLSIIRFCASPSIESAIRQQFPVRKIVGGWGWGGVTVNEREENWPTKEYLCRCRHHGHEMLVNR